MQNYHPLYTKFLLKYYNEISPVKVERLEDIPKEAMDFLSYYSYAQIVRVFILRDRAERNLSLQALSQRYQLPRGFCQSVCRAGGVSS